MYDCKISVNSNLETKNKAAAIYRELGFDMTVAINMFLKKSIQCHGIPFDLILDEVPNEETLEAMREVEEMEKHPENYKGYTSIEEMKKDLEK